MEKQLEELAKEILKLSQSINDLWHHLGHVEKALPKKDPLPRRVASPTPPHLEKWLAESCDFNEGLETVNTALYKTYLRWCDTHEVHPSELVSPMKFGWEIKKHPGVEKVEKKVNGQNVLYRKGIGIRPSQASVQ
jgi:hypothetical protein